MFARRTIVLLLPAIAILLSQEFPIFLIAQDKVRPVQTRVPTEPNGNESDYALSRETQYYKSSPKQGRAPDGKFSPGTKIKLLKRGAAYSLVQSANGIRVYISTDSFEPAQEAEGKNLPRTDLSGKREAGTGRRSPLTGLATVKVGVFNNAASGKMMPATIKTPNIPMQPKPMNMASKINLLKSSVDFKKQFPGLNTEASGSQGLYSRLTPAQPKNDKGCLNFFMARDIKCGYFNGQVTGTIPQDGYAVWVDDPKPGYVQAQGGVPALKCIELTINHQAQPGRMYLFDISVEIEPINQPITIYDGAQVQTVASNNGHLLVVMKASGDTTTLMMVLQHDDWQTEYTWCFYSCEVTELQ